MRAGVIVAILLGSLLAVPLATAATPEEREAECVMPDVDVVCDLAIDSFFHLAFPGFADIAMLVLANVAAVLVLILVIHVLRGLRPLPILKLKVSERVKEVEPGGRVRFKFDLENALPRRPVEVLLERPSLPGYWGAELSAAVVMDSGFRSPRILADDGAVHLTGKRRGMSKASLALTVTAPSDSEFEETLDYAMRAVPMVDGRVKKRRARTAKVTVLVTPKAPIVQIVGVEHEPQRIAPGVPVTTRARVTNRGAQDARDVRVVFLHNGEEVDAQYVPHLGSHADAEVKFHWTPKSGENKIRLAVQ